MWAQCFFDQICLLEVWKRPAPSSASMQWQKRYKANAASSYLRSKSTLTEDSQSKNGEQCVVSILSEKSQKLHSHKQAYFLLQLHISAIFQSQDLQKTWWKHQFPQWKRIESCSPKITHLLYKTSNIRFHEVLWTWCFTKNLLYWHFSVSAWNVVSVLTEQVLTNSHFCNAANQQYSMLCATIQANLLCNKLAWL